MFAPDVPRQNTRLVVDATLADGTHVDPLTGAPPDFEPFDRAWFMNQHWCEVHARMPNWRHHWRNFKDYLYRRPNALGWGPQRQIVRLEVYQVTADMPLPGMLNGVNPQRVPGNGGAFFLHIGDGPTAGCVAIDDGTLVKIMRWLQPGALIAVAK